MKLKQSLFENVLLAIIFGLNTVPLLDLGFLPTNHSKMLVGQVSIRILLAVMWDRNVSWNRLKIGKC